MFRRQCIGFCEEYHEFIHLGLGIISFLLVANRFPGYPHTILIVIALIGSLLPDVDHLFYLFIYGRSDSYARKFRNQLKLGLNQAIEYCRKNHKDNHFILSHNLATPLLALSTLSLSVFFHFLFDIAEDLLVHHRLNPNWFFHFSRS